jgi:hypothetical protein
VKVAPHLARTVYPWHWLHLIEKMFKTPKDVKKHPLENNRNREISKILVMLIK